LHEIPTGEPYYEDAESLIAEASFLVGEWDFAIDTLRAHLSRGSAPVDSVLASIRLAEALLDRAASDADAERREAAGREALTLSRHAAARAPAAVATAFGADKAQPRALVLLPPAERAQRARPSADEDLDRVRALEEGRQHDAARQAADL